MFSQPNVGVSDFRPKRIRKKGPKSKLKQKAKHQVNSKTSGKENLKMIKVQKETTKTIVKKSSLTKI